MNLSDYEIARPNAASLMQSLRAFGYDTATAVADLIDNSITAQATNIYIKNAWRKLVCEWSGSTDKAVHSPASE